MQLGQNHALHFLHWNHLRTRAMALRHFWQTSLGMGG